jgi:hypothetical protein
MYVSCVCCMLCRLRILGLADRSFRGVVPIVCVCVRARARARVCVDLMVCDEKPQQ